MRNATAARSSTVVVPRVPRPAARSSPPPLPLPRPRPRIVTLPDDALMSEPASPPPLPAHRPPSDVLSQLVRQMVDLESYEDALHAGRFCLQRIAAVLPCRASLVHLFDPYRKEFIVIDARGAYAEAMKLSRHTDADPLLRLAMPTGRPFAWHDLTRAPVTKLARFKTVYNVRSILVCPVVQRSYWYGAIELVDPLGGQGFKSEHETAMRYVADRYASFLCTRGVITDVTQVALFAYGV
jgi:hypothetical protein